MQEVDLITIHLAGATPVSLTPCPKYAQRIIRSIAAASEEMDSKRPQPCRSAFQPGRANTSRTAAVHQAKSVHGPIAR